MKWIRIEDRYPSKEECEKHNGWFLVKRRDINGPCISRYDGHQKEFSYDHGWTYPSDDCITDWMPFPELPIESEIKSNE